jgi:hypothetical protein
MCLRVHLDVNSIHVDVRVCIECVHELVNARMLHMPLFWHVIKTHALGPCTFLCLQAKR